MTVYERNHEAEDIAAAIIPQWHKRLVGVPIAYLFKIRTAKVDTGKPPKPKRSGKKIVMAKTSLVSAKMRTLMPVQYQFVIEFNFEVWESLDADRRRALVDHELEHCGNDADGTYLIPHQLEEFSQVLERNGFWTPDRQEFADAVEAVYHAGEMSAGGSSE